MNTRTASRIISYAILLLSLFTMPWWVSFALAAVFIFYFRNYYEALAFAFIMDVIFALPIQRFHGFVLVSLSFTVALLFLVEFLKKRLTFYF